MERFARPAVSATLVVAVTIVLGFGAGIGLLGTRHVAGASPARTPKLSTPASASPSSDTFASGTLAHRANTESAMPGMDSSVAASSTGGDSSSAGSTTPCQGDTVVGAMTSPFWQHFKTAHLERSPADQVNDLLNVSQYTKTHTVLFEHMLGPLVDVVIAASDGFEPFWQHFKTAHLERSPADQVADLLNVSQYTKTHTVLFEHMLEPAVSAATDAGC